MVILGQNLCLGVYDDSMRLLGTITTRSEDAVEWGISTYRKHRKRVRRYSIAEEATIRVKYLLDNIAQSQSCC